MKNCFKRWISLLLAFIMIAGGVPMVVLAEDLTLTNRAPTAPTGLLMELSDTPLGVETEKPSVSWVVNDPDNNEVQTAYQILVATSLDKLGEGIGDVWNSGKVESNENSNVPYGGQAMAAAGIYYWTVRTWDKDGEVSPYAEPQFFSTALKDTWSASAIWSGDDNMWTDTNTLWSAGTVANQDEWFEAVGLTNYTIETRFAITGNGEFGVSFRRNGDIGTRRQNEYVWQIRAAEMSNTGNYLRPMSWVNGVCNDSIGNVDLSSKGVTVNLNKWYTLKISCIGDEISTYIDGVHIATHTVNHHSAGTFGFDFGGSAAALIDSLKIIKDDGSILYNYSFDDGVNPFANGTIESNTALKTGWNQNQYHPVNIFDGTAFTDYVMEMDFNISGNGMGIMFRHVGDISQGRKNGYVWQVRPTGISSAANTLRYIIYAADGNSSYPRDVDLSTVGLTVNKNEWHKIKIGCVGNEIVTYIDGVLVDRFIDSTYRAGTFGFDFGGSDSATIDNLKITKPNGTVVYYYDFGNGVNPFLGGGNVSGGVFAAGGGARPYFPTIQLNPYLSLTNYTYEADFTVEEKAISFSVRKTEDLSVMESFCYIFRIEAGTSELACRKLGGNSNIVDEKAPTVKLSDFGINVNNGEKHHIKIECDGNVMKVWVDGVLCMTVENATEFASGTFGVRCGNTEKGTVDNIKVVDAAGKVILDTDFEDGVNPFSVGGVVENGILKVNNGDKLYYVEDVEELPHKNNIVFLRKEIELTKSVEKAIVSAVGLSRNTIKQYNFKLYVNGNSAGMGSPYEIEGVLSTPYSTFDVTEYLKDGANAIGAICYAVADKRFQLQMNVYYTDGTKETFVTDATWMSLDGTNAFGDDGSNLGGNGSYYAMADNIDARDFPYGWSEVGFDDSAWKPVKVKETIANMSASPIENMYEYEMPVESIVDKGNGNYFITLEKEIVGGLRLTLPDGVEGATLTMLYGEEATGTSVKWALNTLNIYREFWTLKDGAQVIENFGMKCFRYIEIQNSPVAITADMVKGIAYRQDFDRNDSSFESSNELINEIYELTKYTIEATNQDIYTDSQTRERSQHNSGDVYINVKTSHAMSRDYTLALYTARYMNQLDYYISEYNIHAILTAWELYNYLGDKSIIENDYNEFVRLLHLEYYDEDKNLFGFEIDGQLRVLIDWPDYERDSYSIASGGYYDCYYNTVVNSYQYKGLLVVAEMAEILGKTADAASYRAMAADLKTAINATFDSDGDGIYVNGMKQDGTLITSQATPATIYPLLHGLVDDKDAYASGLEYVSEKGFTGSVFGAQFMLELMYDADNGDVGYELLTDTGIRSWYHMIYDLGATITTEAWDVSHKSNMTFSHPWGSAAGNAIVEGIGGVIPLEAGFKKIQIKPQIGDLEFINLTAPTIKGAVQVNVDTRNVSSLADMTVTIPANTTAKVYVPAFGAVADMLVVDGETVAAVRVNNYFVLDNVGSGTHTFSIPASYKMVAEIEDGIFFVGDTKKIELVTSDGAGNVIPLEDAVISYDVANKSVVTVDADGVIKAIGEGSAVISITAVFTNVIVNGVTIPELTLNTELTVSVVAPVINELKLLKQVVDGKIVLKLVAVTDDGVEKITDPSLVTFKSSDNNIATVDENGVVTIVSEGNVTFSAYTDAYNAYAINELLANAVEGDILFYDGFDNGNNFAGANGGILGVGGASYYGFSVYNQDVFNCDYIVETVAKANSGTWALVFCAEEGADGANTSFYHYQIDEANSRLRKSRVVVAGSGAYDYKWFENVDTALTPDFYNFGGENTVKVVRIGEKIKTYINGVLVDVSVEDTLHGGGIGYRAKGGTAKFDSITVKGLALEATLDEFITIPVVTGVSLDEENGKLVMYAVYSNGTTEAISPELVNFKSSDDSKAIVDENGVITLIKGGSVTFTASVSKFNDTLSKELLEFGDVVFTDEFDTTDSFPGEGLESNYGYLFIDKSKIVSCGSDLGWGDYSVKANGRIYHEIGAKNWAITFCNDGNGNYYMWQINEETKMLNRAYVKADGNMDWFAGISLVSVDDGGFYGFGARNDIEIVRIGNEIITYVNGVEVGDTVVDNRLHGGGVGFRTTSTGGAVVNNLTVTEIVATSALTLDDFNDKITAIEIEAKFAPIENATVGMITEIASIAGDNIEYTVFAVESKTGKLGFVDSDGKFNTIYSADGNAVVLESSNATKLAAVYDGIGGDVRYYVDGKLAKIALNGELVYANEIKAEVEGGNVVRFGFGVREINLVDIGLTDTAEIVAFQSNDYDNSIRLLSGVDSFYYGEVGYEVKVYKNDGTPYGVLLLSKKEKGNALANRKQYVMELGACGFRFASYPET